MLIKPASVNLLKYTLIHLLHFLSAFLITRYEPARCAGRLVKCFNELNLFLVFIKNISIF